MNKLINLLTLAVILTLIIGACQTDYSYVNPNSNQPATKGSRNGAEKVPIAHTDGSTFEGIMVPEIAAAVHLGHGDFFGAEFQTFNIRNNNSIPLADRISFPWDSDIILSENPEGDGFAAMTPQGGQKVGYGSNALDGLPVNKLETVNWTRISGQENLVAYMNIWVTDGTNYAVISSENDYRGTDFSDRQEWKVFEYSGSDLSWLFDSGTGARDGSQYLTLNGTRVTLDQLADNITIMDPGAPYPTYAGSGAPRGGFGFNLIWGDTQSNFVGPYQLNELTFNYDGKTYKAVNF